MEKCFNGDGKHPRNEVADYWYRHGVKSERERLKKWIDDSEMDGFEINAVLTHLQELTK